MVGKTSSRGLRDWMVQRVTALLLLVSFGLMLVFLFERGHNTYAVWHGLFLSQWIKWDALLVMLAVCWHAWIGLWTIFTDYVKNTSLRKALEVLVCALMIAYIVWLITILWWS